jgi:hypothetical protein
MTADPDEEATTWAGDRESNDVGRAPRTELAEEPVAARPATPSMLLVTYGVLGGIYLIYTIGWVVVVQRLNALRAGAPSDVLADFMFALGEALAIMSPVIWFAAAFLLTRGRKPLVRLLWILVGLVVVIPWPFVVGVWS